MTNIIIIIFSLREIMTQADSRFTMGMVAIIMLIAIVIVIKVIILSNWNQQIKLTHLGKN